MADRRKELRKVLSLVLIGASLLYIGYVVRAQLEQIRGLPFELAPGQVAWLLLSCVAGIAMSSIYHALIVGRLQHHSLQITRVALAYAIGQVVRYLPGKVMGVVFEVNFLRPAIGLPVVALSHLVQAVNSNAWAAALSSSILLARFSDRGWLLALLLPAAALLFASHRYAWTERTLLAAPFAAKYFDATIKTNLSTPPHAVAATAILVVEWIPFLAGWAILLSGQVSAADAAVLGAAYLIASIASTALIVVPSGIVVREAIFVWIGNEFGFPVSLLLICGVVLRLALTAGDLINVATFWLADYFNRGLANRPGVST